MNRILQRLAAVVLLLIVVLVGYAGLAAPLAAHYAALAQREQQTTLLLARYQRMVARGEAPRAETGLPDLPLSDIYLPGDSPAQAVAALQDRVKSAASNAGARLGSVEVLAPRAADGLTRQAVRARLTADTGSLQQMLHRLEAGRPLLLLDSLYVRARDTRSDTSQLRLDVRVDVVGFAGGADGS